MIHKYTTFLILLLQITNITSFGRLYISGTKFYCNSKEIFLNGANTPWDKWNDFGGDFDENFWNSHFATLKSNGINSSRIWISCNGLHININDWGEVQGPTDKFWRDVDRLLQIAENNGLYVMATLMSFDFFRDQGQKYYAWRKIFDSDWNMDCYVNRYIIPFVQKFQHYNSLMSIDVCNEPDWINENSECGNISWYKIKKLFGKVVNAIHQNSKIPVTIGFGVVKYNSYKYNGDYGAECGIDFNSPHFYEWEAEWFGLPFETSPQNFGLSDNKPAIIGEFPGYGLTGSVKNSKYMSAGDCYYNAYNHGWNGIMAWTSNGVDNFGNLYQFNDATKNIGGKLNW